jgi:arylsulfatase A-like enzyme
VRHPGKELHASARRVPSEGRFEGERDRGDLGFLEEGPRGAYGNKWIKTPNLDALAKESLLFTRPYPESIPTIPARRAIHTGVRTWPFRNWHPVSDDGFKPYGWAPVPEDQVVLAEVLSAEGVNTNIVTDTLHM